MTIDPRSHGPDGSPRARGLRIPFDGRCGAWNAVTDVPGVEVGYETLVAGEGPGALRTGVTALLPRGAGPAALLPWTAGIFSLNGNGEMTGSHWIEDNGEGLGPILVTNTHAIGPAHEAALKWILGHPSADPEKLWLLPTVAETCDAWLSDMNALAVRPEHGLAALAAARSGPLAEGSVGGGTGMITFELKAGTGTASRLVEIAGTTYSLGALVQSNFGRAWQLVVRGVPVGRLLETPPLFRRESGSIIGLVATDAPLLPVDCRRLAKRAGLGVARTGGVAGNGSGDLFLALSTARPTGEGAVKSYPALREGALDPLFEAAAEAVEEAILNALVAARPMTGRLGRHVPALDHRRLVEIMAAHGRLTPQA